MKDWKTRTYQGFNWNFINQIVNKVISFGFGVFLARLLYPEDFGLIAMAAIFLGFAEVFKDFGISSAIIQKKEIKEDELNTSFWLGLLMGSLLALLIVISANPIASFYQEPMLVTIIYVLAVNLFLSSFGLVYLALLTKRLDFKSLFFISVTAEVVSTSLAILAALYGWGFWSILIKLLSRTCIQLVLLWGNSTWQPKLKFAKANIKPLLGFALPLVGAQSMNYWVRNIDDLLIGKFFGEQSLGVYDRSYAFLTLPLGQIKGIVGKVAFPVFAGLQSDKILVKAYFLKMTRLVALFSFPFMSGLYLLANDLVLVLLGEKWIATIEPLKVFALTGGVQSVVVLIGVLFVSQGKTKLQFNLGIFTSLIGVLSIIIGLNWGMIGVAWGLFIATLINLGPNIYFAGKIIEMSIFEWFWNLRGIIFCTLFMFIGVSLLQFFLILEGVLEHLFICSFSGMFFYALIISVVRVDTSYEIQLLISELMRRKN